MYPPIAITSALCSVSSTFMAHDLITPPRSAMLNNHLCFSRVFPPPLTHFCVREIHFRMLLLKLLQHIHLALLLARRLAHLFLPLVEHHLLDHPPRLPIQITQLAILRRDLRRVDGWRGGHDVRPPFHLVGFVEMYRDFFAGGCGFESPGGLGGMDGMGKGSL